jgi:hypothetical protein
MGVPVKAVIDIPDLHNPAVKADITASLELATLKDILKNRFNTNIPVDLTGNGNLSLILQYSPAKGEPPIINGHLILAGATLRSVYSKVPLENLNGRIDFTNNQLIWEALCFKYLEEDYEASGCLTNFDKPGIDLKLSSKRLDLRSLFAVNGNLITVSKCNGRYDNSEFSAQGDINMKDPENAAADITGSLKFDINASKEPFKKFTDTFKGSKPSGRMAANFTLKGSLNDLTHAAIDAEVTSGSLSIYNLKIDDFGMKYLQRNGVMDIVQMHSSLYGGTIDGAGKVDLLAKGLPYQMNADIKNINIEKIKKDTAFKNTNISGCVQAHFGAKGISDDLSSLNAWGKINISNGKLWQLDLFKGMGTMLFKKDFGSVVFSEGSCDFIVKDKVAFINDLVMKSSLLSISGVAKLGFDNSISAYLKTEFTDEGIDAGNMGDNAGVIERYTIMEISGTLKYPKYRIRPDLTYVASDIADNLFQR